MSQYVPRRGSYGIDAPYAFAFISFLVFLELALAIDEAVTSGRFRLFSAVFFVFMIAALYLHFTLRGKFLVWAELLDQLNLRGDERILWLRNVSPQVEPWAWTCGAASTNRVILPMQPGATR
jgi:hypothetical protein